MYTPKIFTQDDTEKLYTVIVDNPFATLITYCEQIDANHIPFIFDKENNQLLGHIARGNPLWKNLENGTEVLVIFQGVNHYITPNWYPSKQRDGKAVPTWNYVVVHVRGKMTFIDGKDWKLAMLKQLTHQHEKSQVDEWKISDAPDDYIVKNLNAIVGIEIDISSITGKWKVSQNQPAENQQGVIDGLAKIDSEQAQLMKAEVTNIDKQ